MYCPNLSFCVEILRAYALWCSNTSTDDAVGTYSPSNHEGMETDDLSAKDNNFVHYVLRQDIFQPVHTLSTASYFSINNAMLIVAEVRPRIFSVCRINSQANTDFYSENLINSSYKTMAWSDQVPYANFSSFLPEIQFSLGCEIRTTR